MAEAAEKEFVIVRDPPFIRRFERPDIDKHAAWFIPRLLRAFPHLTTASAYTWLLNILSANEFSFLYADHGVALAQVINPGLRPEPIVEEVFVWLEDPKDKDQQVDGSYFYAHFYEWAKRKSLGVLVVEENSDIPHELIRETLGKRLFERKQVFAKVERI